MVACTGANRFTSVQQAKLLAERLNSIYGYKMSTAQVTNFMSELSNVVADQLGAGYCVRLPSIGTLRPTETGVKFAPGKKLVDTVTMSPNSTKAAKAREAPVNNFTKFLSEELKQQKGTDRKAAFKAVHKLAKAQYSPITDKEKLAHKQSIMEKRANALNEMLKASSNAPKKIKKVPSKKPKKLKKAAAGKPKKAKKSAADEPKTPKTAADKPKKAKKAASDKPKKAKKAASDKPTKAKKAAADKPKKAKKAASDKPKKAKANSPVSVRATRSRA